MKAFLLLFISFTLTLAWKDNAIIHISQAISKAWVRVELDNLSNCWICHKKPQSVHEARDSLVLLVTSFFLFPMSPWTTINLPEKLLIESNFYSQNIQCFCLPFFDYNCTCPVRHKYLCKLLHIFTPSSYYLNQIFPQSPASPIFARNLEQLFISSQEIYFLYVLKI